MKRSSDLSFSSPAKRQKVTASESRNQFEVFPISRFNSAFPFFRRPVELGSFSLDADRKYVNGRSQLRKYKPPQGDLAKVEFDLRHGYESFIRRDESNNEYLDHLLEFIVNNASHLSNQPPADGKQPVDK